MSREQVRAFLEASEGVRFAAEERDEIYSWIGRTLQANCYGQQKRAQRGLLRRYIEKLAGLSRAQVTRLIGRYLECGEVKESSCKRHRFAQRYTRADVELLAVVDEAHDTLSGPASKRILDANIGSTAKQNTSDWRRSQRPTCTICANRAAIANAGSTTLRRTRQQLLSVSGGARPQTAGLDTCAWTPCIRAIRKE